ncbi:MAG: permease-like cell division protein FtsX [Bacillota bacterium]
MPVLFNGFLYAWSEAMKGLYRNRWLSIACVGVVVVTLLMLGTFMMVSLNIDFITDTVKEQVEIVVYVDEAATLSERDELRALLTANEDLSEVRFVAREEALRRLQLQLGDLLEGYDLEAENPLRDSYEIRTALPESVSTVARDLEGYPAVGSVFYGQGVVENLFTVTKVLQSVGLLLMAGLALTAVFLIAHTIKLTVFIRSDEIMIMKYVGATNWFIRWPFILEGLTLGLLGAVLPLAGLYFIYSAAVEWVVSNNLLFLSLLPMPVTMLVLAKYLVPLGTGLGVLGSAFSMGRFLRV